MAPSTWSHLGHLLTLLHLFSWPPHFHWVYKHTRPRQSSPAPDSWLSATSTRLLAGCCIIAVSAVNCKAQVIVHGVDRRASALAWGMSVETRWTHATPPSLADLARFGCYGQCICHNVSTPCSSRFWPSQGWNHSSFYSSVGLEAIHHEARDLHQLFRWEKSEEREAFERQIHLDLIGKQVCSRLLSRFPPRWSLRDNGAKERRLTKKNEGEKETVES